MGLSSGGSFVVLNIVIPILSATFMCTLFRSVFLVFPQTCALDVVSACTFKEIATNIYFCSFPANPLGHVQIEKQFLWLFLCEHIIMCLHASLGHSYVFLCFFSTYALKGTIQRPRSLSGQVPFSSFSTLASTAFSISLSSYLKRMHFLLH